MKTDNLGAVWTTSSLMHAFVVLYILIENTLLQEKNRSTGKENQINTKKSKLK